MMLTRSSTVPLLRLSQTELLGEYLSSDPKAMASFEARGYALVEGQPDIRIPACTCSCEPEIRK